MISPPAHSLLGTLFTYIAWASYYVGNFQLPQSRKPSMSGNVYLSISHILSICLLGGERKEFCSVRILEACPYSVGDEPNSDVTI